MGYVSAVDHGAWEALGITKRNKCTNTSRGNDIKINIVLL